METILKIPEQIIDDEVVCYMAERYHSSPEDIIRQFLSQGGAINKADLTFTLEDNEMAILRDMDITEQIKFKDI